MGPTTILELIQFLIDVEDATGRKPTSIFVGYVEHQAIKKHMESVATGVEQLNKFWGAKIVYVPIKSYVAAGWSYDEFKRSV